MMMIMMMFAQFCDRSGCQPWLPWISIRAAHSTQVHSTMMSQRHRDNNFDKMMSMIITIIQILFQKRPLQPISTVTIDHDANDDKNVDDELDKDGDDRHHSFVIAIGHVMSGHNDGVSKSVAFVCVC